MVNRDAKSGLAFKKRKVMPVSKKGNIFWGLLQILSQPKIIYGCSLRDIVVPR